MNSEWIRMLALHVEPGDIIAAFGTNHKITHVSGQELDVEFVLESVLDNWRSPTGIIVTMNELTQVSVLRKPKESP